MVGGPMTNDSADKDCEVSKAPNFCARGYPKAQNIDGGAGWYKPHKYPGLSRGIGARGITKLSTRDVTDGTSNTMLLGETKPHYNEYGDLWGFTIPVSQFHLKLNSTYLQNSINSNGTSWQNGSGHASYHTGGAHFTMADGSVRFISDNINYETYCNLGDRMDGNVVGDY